MSRTEHGSARTEEESSSNNASLDSTCTVWGCSAGVVDVTTREGAIQVTCDEGHIESTTFSSGVGSDGDDSPDDGAVDTHDRSFTNDTPDEETTTGDVDGCLDREDGYERGRPDADEVGSDSFATPTVDPSSYVE